MNHILYKAILDCFRNIDSRVVLYYAALLSYKRNSASIDQSIYDVLKDMSTCSDRPFDRVAADLIGKNILHPTSYQVLRANKALDIIKEIFHVGSEGIDVDIQNLFDPPPLPVEAFGAFPPPMDGIACYEAENERERDKILVKYAINFFEIFKAGGVNVSTILKQPRERGILLKLLIGDFEPIVLVYIVNSRRIQNLSELSPLTNLLLANKSERENSLDYNEELQQDMQKAKRARTVIGLVVSTGYNESASVAPRDGLSPLNYTGPVNLPPLEHYLRRKLDHINDEIEKKEKTRKVFDKFVDFLTPHGGFHSGGVFVADAIIDLWRPIFTS